MGGSFGGERGSLAACLNARYSFLCCSCMHRAALGSAVARCESTIFLSEFAVHEEDIRGCTAGVKKKNSTASRVCLAIGVGERFGKYPLCRDCVRALDLWAIYAAVGKRVISNLL